MKTSKIIFISFFTTIGLFLFSLLILGFAYNDKKYSDFRDENIKHESIQLETFKHLVVEKNCRVSIKSGTENTCSYTSFVNKEIIKPVFRLEGDTLFVEGTQTNMNNNVNLVVQQLESVSGQNSNVSFRDFIQSSLTADANKTSFTFNNGSNITNLNVTLKNQSKCNGWNLKAETLKLQSDKSRFDARFQKKLNSIDGEISNHSEARLPQSIKYNLNLDKSSSVKIY